MKSTGIVRKVDELGRVVIPKELRRIQNINEKDPLAIFVEDDKIILQKYEHQKACVVTGELIFENKELANGIVLSPAGAKLLLNELEDYIDVHMK
ncbi:AbrB/MazE/SpoVT family DNA-binding domain-containing protein [Cytobacillus horneckiae]|uniref:AbrB/MazE/SpoVT family DNA-binding domain-containing protein n=1 Tax=Cytobacillus horneckiae TaxID=549687 RepID=UPI003D1D0B48